MTGDRSIEFSLIEEAEIRLSHRIKLGGQLGHSEVIRISLHQDAPSPLDFLKFSTDKDYKLLQESVDLPTLARNNDVRIYSILQKDYSVKNEGAPDEAHVEARAKVADSVLVSCNKYGVLEYDPISYTSAKAAVRKNGREEFSVAFNSLFKGKVILKREIDEKHITSTVRLFEDWLEDYEISQEQEVRLRKVLVLKLISTPREERGISTSSTKKSPPPTTKNRKSVEPWTYTLYALVAMAIGGLAVGYANMMEVVGWFNEEGASHLIHAGIASIIAYAGLKHFRYEDNFTTYGLLIGILGLYLHFSELELSFMAKIEWFKNIQLFYTGLLLFIIGFLPGLVVIAFLPLQIGIAINLYGQYQADAFGKPEYMSLLVFLITLAIQLIMYKKWQKKKKKGSTMDSSY